MGGSSSCRSVDSQPYGVSFECLTCGRASANELPDPHFKANQVMELWPSGKTNRESVGVAEQAKARENETTADGNIEEPMTELYRRYARPVFGLAISPTNT